MKQRTIKASEVGIGHTIKYDASKEIRKDDEQREAEKIFILNYFLVYEVIPNIKKGWITFINPLGKTYRVNNDTILKIKNRS